MTAAPPQHLSLCSVKFFCTKLRTEKTPSILCLTHLLALLHYPKAFKSFFLQPHEKPPNCLHANVWCVS